MGDPSPRFPRRYESAASLRSALRRTLRCRPTRRLRRAVSGSGREPGLRRDARSAAAGSASRHGKGVRPEPPLPRVSPRSRPALSAGPPPGCRRPPRGSARRPPGRVNSIKPPSRCDVARRAFAGRPPEQRDCRAAARGPPFGVHIGISRPCCPKQHQTGGLYHPVTSASRPACLANPLPLLA